MYRRHRRAVRRSEGSTTISQRSKRDRDTEPDLIRNQDILRKISTTKKLPRSFVMGSEASERSEKNPITTSKATQRGTVTFPSTSTSSAADALRSIFDGYLNTKSDLLLLHLQSSTPSLLLLLISHHLRDQEGIPLVSVRSIFSGIIFRMKFLVHVRVAYS